MTGAVIARAVEPPHGENAGLGHACLNCGETLTGPYCAACGQMAHLHRSLMGLWHDIAHGVFHFEGKVWRTLPMLAWRPGDLTRRYIHGERARFVSPLALFLFTVFLMFATFESVGGPIQNAVNLDRNGVKVDASDFKAELAKAKARVNGLESRRHLAVEQGLATTAIDKELEDARGDVTGITAATNIAFGPSLEGLPQALPKGVHVNIGWVRADDRVNEALKNPKLLLYKLQSSAYKFAWALIPLSLPFMWLIFAWRRQYKLYDHAIFVTYSLSFVMVLLVAMALLSALGVSTGWALFLVPVHMYRQLKQAYKLGWFSALWRTATLLIVSSIVLTLFGTLLLVLGMLG